MKQILFAILSSFYIFIVKFRNILFDFGLLKGTEFDIPVICVGNITVGGTGKTPMTELLIDHYSKSRKIAIISRGYKRSTRGYVEVEVTDSFKKVGDEPLQMKRKYPDILVVVCEKRVKGIKTIIKKHPDVELVIMDDGFQHRYVKPRVNIVMIDATRPFFEDKPLPWGSLRDNRESLHRADLFVVSKCPATQTPYDRRVFINELEANSNQHIVFTRIANLDPVATYPDLAQPFDPKSDVIAMAGIGNPRVFLETLCKRYNVLYKLICKDHHDYNTSEIKRVAKQLESNPKLVVVTTEKDSIKFLSKDNVPQILKERLYYTPITMEFVTESREILLNWIDYDIK